MWWVLACAMCLAATATRAATPKATPDKLVEQPTTPTFNSTRFSATVSPSDPKSIWLLDTYNGSLSRCEAQNLDVAPKCSPWAEAPGASPYYRYDPETKKMVPMNEAARRRAASAPNPN